MAGGCTGCQRRADTLARLLRRVAGVVESRNGTALTLIAAAVLAGHALTFAAGYVAGRKAAD